MVGVLPEPSGSTTTASSVLTLSDVAQAFGGVRAVDGITLSVERGEILGIVGPNGAGKTSLLNAICGVHRLTAGRIWLNGERIDGRSSHRIAREGIGRTFQSAELFHEFSARQYVMLGGVDRQDMSIWRTALGFPSARRGEAAERDLAANSLESVGLGGVADVHLAELPFGYQKLVDIARVLNSSPEVILLDEPTAGTRSDERRLLHDLCARLRERGLTMLIVDHDVDFIANIVDRLGLMVGGKLVVVDSPAEVLKHPQFVSGYLGR